MKKEKTVQPTSESGGSTKPLVSSSGLIATWEGKEMSLSSEFVDAVKALLIAEIKLMRQIEPEMADCWYCGSAEIRDMASSDYLVMRFGGRDEVDYLSKDHIFVTAGIIEYNETWSYLTVKATQL